MANKVKISDLGEKEQAERLKFWFDLTGDSAFVGTGAETIDENAAWYVTTTDARSVNIPSLVAAYDYDNTNKKIAVELAVGGTVGTSYYVKGLLIVASDRRYVVVGRFTVVQKGATVI